MLRVTDARKLEDLGATATGAELPAPQPVENVPRPLASGASMTDEDLAILPPSADDSESDDDDFLKLPGQTGIS